MNSHNSSETHAPTQVLSNMGGYTKLATLMGAHPSAAIIRRFGRLNAQNILYMQAELVHLESSLNELEDDDHISGNEERVACSFDWFCLRHYSELEPDADAGGSHVSGPRSSRSAERSGVSPRPVRDQSRAIENRRWALICDIREKLRQYNEMILQQVEINKLSNTTSRDLKTLSKWMDDRDHGGVFLSGQDRDIWSNPDQLDLVVLAPQNKRSLFSAILSDGVIHWFHRAVIYPITMLLKKRPLPDANSRRLDRIAAETNLTHYSENTLARVVQAIAVAFSSLLPLLAIIVLYGIGNTETRLRVVAAFTFGFSIIVGLFTNGDLDNVFAASAAFAAVQVVFVGSVGSVQSEQGSAATVVA